MSITRAQNSKENIRLLIAQSHLYSVAKRFRAWQTVIIIGLAIAAPIFVLLPPRWQNFMAVVGVLWTGVSVTAIGRLEDEKIKQAATIQEQFDVGLYGITWNSVRVDTRITPEIISEANQEFKGNTNEFKSWYGDVSKVAHPLDVLLCQRSNLVWDWRLRRRYAMAVSIVTGTYLCLGALALYFLFRQPAREILIAWLLPSLSAFVEGTKLAIKHFAVAKEKQDLERIVASAWQKGLRDPASLRPTILRQIQDRIYDLRIGAPPVPDWWNRRYRSKFEANMREALKTLQSEAEDASRNSTNLSKV